MERTEIRSPTVVLIGPPVFRRPAATFECLRDRRGLDKAFRSDVFRDEISVLAKAITRPLDLNDGRMVEMSRYAGGIWIRQTQAIAEDLQVGRKIIAEIETQDLLEG